MLAVLPNGPEDARWLDEEERAAIAARLAAEPPHAHQAFWPMLRDPRVWALAIPDFGIVLSTYGLGLWLPQIVKGLGYSNLGTGLVVAAVYALSSVVSVGWCLSSDRAGERIRHVAVAALLGASGLAVAAFAEETTLRIVALAVGMAGTLAAISVFWALPSGFLKGTAAAGGIAPDQLARQSRGLRRSLSDGRAEERDRGYAAGFLVLAAGLVMTAATILLLGRSLGFRQRAHAFDKFAPPV